MPLYSSNMKRSVASDSFSVNFGIFCNIVLRDRRAGGYGFCKPAGVISSQGSEAPEG